jgi:hypothetical protein
MREKFFIYLQCQRVATILTTQTIAGKERDWFHAKPSDF